MLNSSSTNADSFLLDGFDDKGDADELSLLHLDTVPNEEQEVPESKTEIKSKIQPS